MIDNFGPEKIYSDLASDPATKFSIDEDCRLLIDDFAKKHSKTVSQRYMQDGFVIGIEDSHQAAERLWHYLREPQKNKKPIPLNISGVAYVTVDGFVRYLTAGPGIPLPADFERFHFKPAPPSVR